MPAILDPDKVTFVPRVPPQGSQKASKGTRPPSSSQGINLSKFLSGYPLVAARAARSNDLPIALFLAQLNQEAHFDPTAVSPAGALGIAQFMPDTAQGMGVNPLDPIAAIRASARMNAANLKKSGNVYDMLSLYNSGKGWAKGQDIAETRDYVNKILSAAAQPFGGVTQNQKMAKLFPMYGKQDFSWGGGPDAHGARALGNWESDNAYDLMAPAGSPVYAVAKGRINPNKGFGPQNSSNPKVYGSRLHLNVPGPNELFYTHLSQIAPGIQPGSRVTPGQLLGWVADYGDSDHTHFASKIGDPKQWLQGKFASLGVGPTYTPQQDYSGGMVDTAYGPAPATVVAGVEDRVSPVADAMAEIQSGAYGGPMAKTFEPLSKRPKRRKKSEKVDALIQNLLFMDNKLPGGSP